VDRHAHRHRFDFGHASLKVIAQVELAQQHDRLRAPFPDHRQRSFDTSRVEVVVERRHEEHHVEVRGQHLRCRHTTDTLSNQR
jgi:hypothetical protein